MICCKLKLNLHGNNKLHMYWTYSQKNYLNSIKFEWKDNKKTKKMKIKLTKENKKPFVLWVAHNLLHFYYFDASSLYFS
jgi:hypothetical protein